MEVSEDTARAALRALRELHIGECHEAGIAECGCDTAKAWRELARLLGER